MELKQRKRINNLKHLDIGQIAGSHYYTTSDLIGSNGLTLNYSINNYNGEQAMKIGTISPNNDVYRSNSTPNVSGSKASNIAQNAVAFTGATMNAFTLDRDQNLIIADAGSKTAYGGGFTWRKQNEINNSEELNQLRKSNTANTLGTAGTGAALGASIGSIFPGAGTIIGGAIGAVAGAITGLIGGKSRKRKLQKRLFNALQLVNINNNYSLASSQSDYLDQNYNNIHQYTYDDLLYVANEGKDKKLIMKLKKLPKYSSGKDAVVATPYGDKKGAATSIVGQLEPIADLDNGFVHVPYYKNGKSGKNENILSSVQSGDNNTVFSTKYGYDKIALPAALRIELNNKKYFAQLDAYNKYADRLGSSAKQTLEVLKKVMDMANKNDLNFLKVVALAQKTDPRRKETTLGLASGKSSSSSYSYSRSNVSNIPWWQRAIPNAASLFGNIAEALYWKNSKVHRPDTYAPNPNEGRALLLLSSLHSDPYALLRAMLDVERRGIYNNNRAGGLSGALKYLANTALNLGLQKNYANVLNQAREQDNLLRAQYANAALQAGTLDAKRRLAANQFDEEAYNRANGKKITNFWKSAAGAGAALNQWYANEFKYNTFRDTLDLYQQLQYNDYLNLSDALRDRNNNSSTVINSVPSKNNTIANVPNSITQPSVATPPYVNDNKLYKQESFESLRNRIKTGNYRPSELYWSPSYTLPLSPYMYGIRDFRIDDRAAWDPRYYNVNYFGGNRNSYAPMMPNILNTNLNIPIYDGYVSRNKLNNDVFNTNGINYGYRGYK